MSVVDTPQVQKIAAQDLEVATRALTLSDAMRLGSTVTTQACGWGEGDTACALASARIAAAATGWCE